MHFQLGRQKCTSSWDDKSAILVGKTKVHFQLGRQKCTFSWEDRSALPVRMTDMCTTSWEDRSALQVGKIGVCIKNAIKIHCTYQTLRL